MKRYNLQAFGNVETFLEKIPRKKKSLVVNAIISNALKSNKLNEILVTFFTHEEIEELFNNKKTVTKKEEGKKTTGNAKEKEVVEKKDSTFKVEI